MYNFIREDAVNHSNALLEKTAEMLDKQHGAGFSKENPLVVIHLSTLYTLEIIAFALARISERG